MRNQAPIFLGLFLMVLGLYGVQLKKKGSFTENKKYSAVAEITPVPLQQTRIQLLYEKISLQKMFSNKIDGIRLSPAQPPIKNDLMITFYGDEVFSNEGFAIHDSWVSALDFLAEAIKTELGLNVEISGYADQDNPREKKPSDYGSSALAFSYARAEWLAHYFEHKHAISISDTFILRGLGAVPQGKKIELRFYYH